VVGDDGDNGYRSEAINVGAVPGFAMLKGLRARQFRGCHCQDLGVPNLAKI